MLSLINTHLNGFEPLQIKIFMYCLGTPSATAMAPLISLVKENPDHQITAWHFHKPEKKVSNKISRRSHTFVSYVVSCELAVAKLADITIANAKDNYICASSMLFKKRQLELTAKEENGTPTGIIMREYVAYLVETGFTFEGNQTMWGRFSKSIKLINK